MVEQRGRKSKRVPGTLAWVAGEQVQGKRLGSVMYEVPMGHPSRECLELRTNVTGV